jgi:hypothetical protein
MIKFYSKAETFLNYVAKSDEGLQRELSTKGAKNITNSFLVWNALMITVFIAWRMI